MDRGNQQFVSCIQKEGGYPERVQGAAGDHWILSAKQVAGSQDWCNACDNPLRGEGPGGSRYHQLISYIQIRRWTPFRGGAGGRMTGLDPFWRSRLLEVGNGTSFRLRFDI